MSGEPPEGAFPPAVPTLASSTVVDEGGSSRRSGEAEGAPRTIRMVPRPGNLSASAKLPDLADDGAPTERRPALAEQLTDGPPEINRFLSPPPPALGADASPNSAPESGSATRRRSRRTVKIPNDAVPPKTAPAPQTAAPAAAPVPAASPAASVVEAGARSVNSGAPPRGSVPPPLQAIPPSPPIPTLTGPRASAPDGAGAAGKPSIPRPGPKAPASVPAASADEAPKAAAAPEPPPPAPEETYEVIRPMRIISIGTVPPSAPPPVAASVVGVAAVAPPPAADDSGWDEASSKRAVHDRSASVSRTLPPADAAGSPAQAAVEMPVVPPPPPVPKAPKPPVVEEVEAIEEVEEHAAATAPRGATTDEIEPLPAEDEIEDRISDFDDATTGEMVAVDVPIDVDLEEPKPKKPPPPPTPPTTKRQISIEPPPLTPPAPSLRPGDGTPGTPPVVAVAASSAPTTEGSAPPPVAAAPASAAPASVPTLELSGRKRQKPWWEEIFSDDYIRTLEKVEHKAIRKECDFIEDRLGLEKGAIMLDLACGAGTHAVELASRGYNVVGYDLSLAMLARAQDEAQERGQKINFLQGDMREMAFEEAFDGIYSWSTSFGYFDDEKNLNVLSRIHRGLRQGGMLLLDIINRDYVCPRQPSLVWFEGDGCVCMDEMHVDFFTSRLRVKRTVMFEDGRARECDYSIRLYGLHELGKMLHDTGFKVVEITGHPAHPGVFFGSESPRIIVLAERG